MINIKDKIIGVARYMGNNYWIIWAGVTKDGRSRARLRFLGKSINGKPIEEFWVDLADIKVIEGSVTHIH